MGNQFLTYILKRMKVFYDRYETLLHIFTSDSVRQVLPKFLPLNCGRKITDFKEWSKIRVCCFFWQIKLGKNLFCLGSKKIRSYALILFKKGEGTFNLKDLRFNLRLNVFIANDIKNLGEIGITKVWSKTFHQNRKRKRHKNTESKRQKNKLQFWNQILNENLFQKNLRLLRSNLSVTLTIYTIEFWKISIWLISDGKFVGSGFLSKSSPQKSPWPA